MSSESRNPADDQGIESLRQSEETFRLLVASVKDYAIFMMDPNGTILTWNDGAQAIKQYTAQEIIGQNFRKFYTQEDLEDGKPERELVIAAKEGKYEEEGWRVRKDGSRFWANVVITAVYNTDGTLRGFGKVTRDLTARRAAQLELEERTAQLELANADLERANTAKDRFLSTMSHELRTPLNSILGFIGILLMKLPGPLNAEQERQLRQVQASATHLLSLINDILDLAKIESGKMQINPEGVQVNEILDYVATSLRPLAKNKGLELREQKAANDQTVFVDKRILTQILINLTNNAIKFTESGYVMLSVETDKNELRYRIADTGIGIKAEQQATLFQAFNQVDESRRHEGTGLGLYISQHFARAIGARIESTSEFGKGSIFSLVLSRKASE